jgi:hypothetical protein
MVTPYTSADGNGDCAIDAADCGVWHAHFGQMLPQIVPESSAAVAAAVDETVAQLARSSGLAGVAESLRSLEIGLRVLEKRDYVRESLRDSHDASTSTRISDLRDAATVEDRLGKPDPRRSARRDRLSLNRAITEPFASLVDHAFELIDDAPHLGATFWR